MTRSRSRSSPRSDRPKKKKKEEPFQPTGKLNLDRYLEICKKHPDLIVTKTIEVDFCDFYL
jgi:hypothetical protein